MRGVSLVMRFALMFYLARYLNLSAVGMFGLATGLAGMAPAAIGCGVNYFMNREIVGVPLEEAGRKVRDRLVLTAICVATGVALLGAGVETGLVGAWPYMGLVTAIVALECFAFDIHFSLISLKRPLAANFLLFVRSTSWIFPAIAFGVMSKPLRNLEFLLYMWLSGLLLSYIILPFMVKDLPLRSSFQAKTNFRWILCQVRGGWLIYINDISLYSQVFLGRFIVNHYLGLSSTGQYTLYWSVANSIHVLVTSAVIQISMPILVASYRDEGGAGWAQILRGEVAKVIVLGAPLCLLATAVMVLLPPILGLTHLPAGLMLFILMCIGTLLRLVSDTLNYGLYSRGQDNAFALVNLFGCMVSAIFSIVGIRLWGLTGVGASMIVTPALLLSIRLWLLRGGLGSGPPLRRLLLGRHDDEPGIAGDLPAQVPCRHAGVGQPVE